MPFTLREPELPDAPLIAELHVATWREAYSQLLPEEFFTEEHVQGRHQMWNRVLGNPRKQWCIRIAESNGRIIGFAVAGPSFNPEGQPVPRERQLFSLYVAAAHYGTGAGQALLDATAGDGPAMLWVAKENPRAVAFYRRNGFEFDGAEQTDPGAARIVDARMVR
ncbi:N-acetyltransferase [Arthrobacter sp. NicSoilB4]|uniref:GNAT family N-acetyltransferase n=1 Tax=Arthrobacter sp. NicSoilB4 TaxID=2830997 RepID=UPI001CC5D73E|nr:GNAT family N-acetyltransferase [Arthrobacter sp. NicSoilB4]BCW66537.1 N-acetyltransferase [Arthrobacter sp. NicSoilB4]